MYTSFVRQSFAMSIVDNLWVHGAKEHYGENDNSPGWPKHSGRGNGTEKVTDDKGT
jgi:hypothetical protein